MSERKNVLMPEAVFFSAAELAKIIGTDFESVNKWIRANGRAGVLGHPRVRRRSLVRKLSYWHSS